jgi:hypothetical protein
LRKIGTNIRNGLSENRPTCRVPWIGPCERPSLSANHITAMTKRQNKPVIYLFVILPILIGGGIGFVVVNLETFSRFRNVEMSAIPRINGLLISLPAFFLWIPASLLISNLIFYFVPLLRRIANNYAVLSGHPGFKESQKTLLKLFWAFSMVCIPLIIWGFIF